jgi:GLPGLI family protein
MKQSFNLSITLAFAFIFSGIATANIPGPDEPGQDIMGGTVTYEQTTYIEFDYQPTGNPQRDQFFASLPNSRIKAKILYFNLDHSLYVNDVNTEIQVLEPRQAMVLDRMAMGRGPSPILQKVYMNYKEYSKTEQLELMTRLFLIESKIEEQAWKPGTEQRKIQGYICQNAIMKKGDKTITAWFTPQIPVSMGPELFTGLPGLILAIDIDGKNVILATSVDLTNPEKEKVKVPKEGQKTSQEEFDKMLAEKVKEWEVQRANRQRGRRDFN